MPIKQEKGKAMWKFYQPVNVIFGEGELKNLGKYMEERHLNRAFLVADAFLVNSGAAARVEQYAAGKIAGVSSDVEPNPTLKNVSDVVEKASALNADCMIAFGGGSAMDCAKAASAVLAEHCDVGELLNGYQITKALPIIAVPTTAGTGSEVTAGAVLSDKERGLKAAIFSQALFPTLALVDPELTYTVPAKVTAATGLDVLAHAFDAMTSVKANHVTDALALEAAKLSVKYLQRAVKDGQDKEARAGMAQASTIAGLAFSQTGTTGSHACSYILTSRYHMPHGEACAFTLDSWILINSKVKPELNDYAAELGFADVTELSDWINKLKKEFEMRLTLREIGAGQDDLASIVDAAMSSGNMANNIAQIGREGVMTVFKAKL